MTYVTIEVKLLELKYTIEYTFTVECYKHQEHCLTWTGFCSSKLLASVQRSCGYLIDCWMILTLILCSELDWLHSRSALWPGTPQCYIHTSCGVCSNTSNTQGELSALPPATLLRQLPQQW